MPRAQFVCHVLLIDGVPWVFTTNDGVDDAWALAEGFERSYPGFQRPSALPCALDLRSGDFTDSTCTLEIEDLDGTLPRLFGGNASVAPLLIDTIEPRDVPPVVTWGMHVGPEAVGPAGERHRYSCWPGFSVGRRHLGSQAAEALNLPATPITEWPRLWVGRRWTCWLVQCFDGVWETLPRATLVGLGTLLGQGRVAAGRWSFKATGPEGWIGGNLAAGSLRDEPFPCAPILRIGPHAYDGWIEAALDLVRLDDQNIHHTWVKYYSPVTTTIAAGDRTYAEVVAAMSTVFVAVESNASSGWSYAFAGSSSTVRYSTALGGDGIVVRWNRDMEVAGGPIGSARYVVRLRVSAPEWVWAALGYDVRLQPYVHPVDAADQYCQFQQHWLLQGHWTGSFYSATPSAMLAFEEQDFGLVDFDPLLGFDASDAYSNYQSDRRWPPLYPGGAVTWTLEPGQEVQLLTLDPVLMLGTLSRPPPADPDDGTYSIPYSIGGGVGNATHQALVLVEGPYRHVDDLDGPADTKALQVVPKERADGRTKQVFRMGYRSRSDGSVATDSDGFPRLVVYAIEDPLEHGFEYPRLNGPWSGWRQPPVNAEPMGLRPLVSLEFASGEGQRADLIMLRALATTGTATGWYTDKTLSTPLYGLYAPAPVLEPGVNDVDAAVPTDAEVAALGLAVPADLIAPAAEWSAAIASVGTHLSRAKVTFGTTASFRQLFRDLLSPLFRSWSFAGGRFGILDPTTWPDLDSVALVVTPDLYAGKYGDPRLVRPGQELREWAPIDVGTFDCTREPISSSTLTKFTRRSPGVGVGLRSQAIPHRVVGAHLVNRRAPILGHSWLGEIHVAFDRFCNFWERQHFPVDLVLHAEDAAEVWPGDTLLLTDPWLVDPSGSAEYGITAAIGRFISRSYSAKDARVRMRAIVNAETALVLYAPSALATEYIAADGVYQLVVEDDWLGCRTDGSLDVAGFVEPPYSSDGDLAQIEVFSFDDWSWSRGLIGEVASVLLIPGACKLILSGPITGGTWLRDQHHVVVLRRVLQQPAAWVARWLAAISDADGIVQGIELGKSFRD